MTLDEAKELFAYDTWANEMVFDAVAELSEEELKKDLRTSHESVLSTLIHLVGAEIVWLSRWKGGKAPLPDASEFPTLDSLRSKWSDVRDERDAFVASMSGEQLSESIEISSLSGESFSHTFAVMFRHLVNHSSYHRGQVVTLLRQLGRKPPGTDLIRYHRRSS